MKHVLPFIIAITLASCAETPEQKKEVTEDVLEAAGEASTPEVDSMCYLLSEGIGKKKDTSIVRLTIKGNDVRGRLVYMPYEKDRRSGTIAGKKEGKRIDAVWIYMQEGMTDSIAINFRLEDEVLKQQQSVFDNKSGKEYFPNNASYNRYYKQVDCTVFDALLQ